MSIKKTEQSIHTATWKEKRDIKKGSGKTEFIKKKHFKDVKNMLNSLQAINNLEGPFFFSRERRLSISLFLTILLGSALFIAINQDIQQELLKTIQTLLEQIQ